VNETVERRVFGAIEFVDDVTDARVLDSLRLTAPALGIVRNRLGLYVVRTLEGHDDYTRALDNPPTAPARQDFALLVEDPNKHYLPQAVTLSLPRLLPTAAVPVADGDNALVPLQVRLFPAAALPLRASWAVLRLRVIVDGSNPPIGLANVLVEAVPQPVGLSMRRTVTDRQGEALLVIQGAPPILPDAGPAGLTREFVVSVSLIVDKAVVKTTNDAAIAAPDIARIVARRDAAHADVSVIALGEQLLSSGTSRRHVEAVTWP
jgi:hypothetical protein